MTIQRLRIGTRGSALALWQAHRVRDRLIHFHPGLHIELIPIKTKGDKILDVPLAQVGGKGLFVKELEDALLNGEADLAVHSMKDVPAEFPEGLTLGPILEREDPRDVLLSLHFASLTDLPSGARVGTSSLRRQSQLLHRRPDLHIFPLRGNVNTRIAKLVQGEFDAIILAAAGVKRLQMTDHVREFLAPEQMLPAVGQGAIGLELRCDDPETTALVAPLNHPPTQICVMAERAFLATLEGGCQVPIAAHARLEEQQLMLHGLVAELDGSQIHSQWVEGNANDAESLGRTLAATLLARGAKELLERVYHSSMAPS